MSTTAITATSPSAPSTAPDTAPNRLSASVRRVMALARMELRMLLRNRTALVNALLVGPALVLAVTSMTLDLTVVDRPTVAASMLALLPTFGLMFAGYYNLCTVAVARREELMLKRLLIGEVTRVEALVGMAVPALAVIVGQVVLGAVAVIAVVGMPPLTNPILAVLGLLLGFAALASLGYASAIYTRTVESAQVTTLVPLIALMVLGGAVVPLANMNESLRAVAEYTPLAATGVLVNLGVAGVDVTGAAVSLAATFALAIKPVLVLVGWTALSGYLIRATFAWEPRR